MPQGYVIGKWASNSVFVAEDLQPADKITNLKAMQEWAVKHFEDAPGEYALINAHNGSLLIGKQLELKLGHKGAAGFVCDKLPWEV